MREEVFIGTMLKFALTITCEGFDVDEDEFEVDIKHGSHIQHFEKDDLIRDENGQYYVCFDTKDFGSGLISAVVTAHVPDDDFDGGIRDEVQKVDLIRVALV